MKIRLEVKAPEYGDRYSLSRPVRGTVTLRLSRSTAISGISVYITGTMTTRMLDPRFGWRTSSDDDLIDSHEFCQVSEVILPRMNTLSPIGGFTLPQGAHPYEFEINFPPMTLCKESDDEILHLVTALPPTFESYFNERRGIGKVEYLLKAHVKRPGKWRRNSSAEQKLAFRPPNPSFSSILTSFRDSVVSATLKLDPHVSEHQHPAPSSSRSDSQGPVLLLEVRLPFPAVLYTGENPPLRLLVRKFPTACNDLSSVELQSIAVRLSSTITIKVESSRIAWGSSQNLLNKTGLQAPVHTHQQENSESFEISGSILEGVVIPRDITPSFTACTLRQDHALQVIAGFSIGREDKLHLIEATINVEVHSGIETERRSSVLPEYNTGPHSLINSRYSSIFTEAGGVPLRVGCLRHLGIGSGLGHPTLQPPAYCT